MISIIIPIYNSEKTLKRCVDSILSQTFSDFELLLVDDGSTDGSAAICDEYHVKDARVKVYHKENGGVCSARNLGLSEAKGEYIGWVDSDDFIEADMYELLYKAIINNSSDIAYCDYCFNGKVCKLPDISDGKGEFFRRYLLNPVSPLWITLARKSLYERYELLFPFDNVIGEDLLVTCKLFYYANKCAYVNYSGYNYIEVGESLSRNYTREKSRCLLNNVLELNFFFSKTELYQLIKAELAWVILSAKSFYLFMDRDPKIWYNTESWSNEYILTNKLIGIKGKGMSWLVYILYRIICCLLTVVKIY